MRGAPPIGGVQPLISVFLRGLLGVRPRKKALAGCTVSCSTSCGCAPATSKPIFTSPVAGSKEPVVCTADLAGNPTVLGLLEGYRAVFVHLRDTERFDGGFRWIFEPSEGLEDELRALAEKEHQCCRFFEFHVRAAGGVVIWETRGDERSRKIVEEFSNLPARLAENATGEDVAALKRSAGAAGLVFKADQSPST